MGTHETVLDIDEPFSYRKECPTLMARSLSPYSGVGKGYEGAIRAHDGRKSQVSPCVHTPYVVLIITGVHS